MRPNPQQIFRGTHTTIGLSERIPIMQKTTVKLNKHMDIWSAVPIFSSLNFDTFRSTVATHCYVYGVEGTTTGTNKIIYKITIAATTITAPQKHRIGMAAGVDTGSKNLLSQDFIASDRRIYPVEFFYMPGIDLICYFEINYID